MFCKEDIITSDAYQEAFPDVYYKTDVIHYDAMIIWRGSPHYPPEKNTDIIISGHSDYGINDHHVFVYNPKIWWTINEETNHPTVSSLPLGVTNNTNESRFHKIFGDNDILIKIMHLNIPKQNLAYINFNITTHHERQYIFEKFRDNDWVTTSKSVHTIQGRERYLMEIKSHEYVFCPRGNGVDTHRLWETLYMGSIPILKRHVAYDDFSDFPICFVDNWDDVTETFLRDQLPIIKNVKFDTRKLTVKYWIDKIKNT